jgi:hypothetical protein
MKRIALASTTVVAVIAAAAFATAGLAQSSPTTSLQLVSTAQESVGFGPMHREPHPGDRFGAGDILTGDDTGIDRTTCTIISKHDALCTAVAQLSKGTLTAEALVSFGPEPAGDLRYAITGGTGAYDGAGGTAVVTDVPGTSKSDIHITLTR